MTKANNGIFEPEMRLPACIFFACFIPISFFWYGWSIQAGVHVSTPPPCLLTHLHPSLKILTSPVDRSHNRPHPLRFWYDGYFHSNSNIRHRQFPILRCVRNRCIDSITVVIRSVFTTCWTGYVCKIRVRMGK